jgi:hypothetical protein
MIYFEKCNWTLLVNFTLSYDKEKFLKVKDPNLQILTAIIVHQ